MAKHMISERIAVQRRYVRAADIARDLNDPAALDGYILTSRARDALVRLSSGLSPGSTQRAFRVTGPYGSGKSSFGLLLARLCQSNDPRAQAIASHVPVEHAFASLAPLVVVGRRASLARNLLSAVAANARARFGEADTQALRCEHILGSEDGTRIDTEDVLNELVELSERLRVSDGAGLLLLVDEMGRFLEFAATNQASEDPALFQQLAERASGSAHENFAVVAFLHHRFDDYLGNHDDWSSKEWARSAERYEEIAFTEPREQSVHLLANALTTLTPHSPAVCKAADSLYSQASKRSLFAMPGKDLRALGAALFPLHPASVACLTSAASRFGQHDRSIFSFLQSSEPSGFQQFAHATRYDANAWYRLDSVFDYLASLGGLRFDSRDRDRRWALGREAVDALATEERAIERVLKAVAVIATLEPVAGLQADIDTLSWALGMDSDEVQSALATLVSTRVLYERAASKDYSLWSNSSVDLGFWLAEAERAIRKTDRLAGDLSEGPSLRPIIAQRHYHETGTLRNFAVCFGDDVPLVDGSDGMIVIVPLHPSDDPDAARASAVSLSKNLGSLGLVHLRRIEDEDLNLSHQLRCWKWIETSCTELRMDELARGEVVRSITSLEQRLQARLAPIAFGNGTDDWYYVGKQIAIADRAALSRQLSQICGTVFKKAPLLRNELINRTKLSSAIAAARMRLLKRMIEHEEEEHLGLTGAPPERTIYRSMFDATSMHRKVGGAFRFHPPDEDFGLGWRPVWDRIEELVRADHPVSLETLMAELAKAPYGLRAGPALLLIAAVMLHHRSTIALIERGTFQPELTEAHFMRLAKNPQHFALKRLSAHSETDLLEHLASQLSIFDGTRPSAELKPVVQALFMWWRDVSDYARSTKQIDNVAQAVRATLKKAKEPIELLFVTLPDACSARSDEGIDIERYASVLDHALTQIADALPQLRRQVEVRLIDAFGARSLAGLRQQIRADYEDHLLELGDYKLRAFIERAMNIELGEELWLDGVASLLVGKRLESWEDGLLDQFGFEVRRIAQALARRLAALRVASARSSPVTAVHITTSNGEDRSFYLHHGASKDKAATRKLRQALQKIERPEAILIGLLQEIIDERLEEDAK
ncbi:MAG: hypothetical protein R3E02_10835 [Blastomonas sp.]